MSQTDADLQTSLPLLLPFTTFKWHILNLTCSTVMYAVTSSFLAQFREDSSTFLLSIYVLLEAVEERERKKEPLCTRELWDPVFEESASYIYSAVSDYCSKLIKFQMLLTIENAKGLSGRLSMSLHKPHRTDVRHLKIETVTKPSRDFLMLSYLSWSELAVSLRLTLLSSAELLFRTSAMKLKWLVDRTLEWSKTKSISCYMSQLGLKCGLIEINHENLFDHRRF